MARYNKKRSKKSKNESILSPKKRSARTSKDSIDMFLNEGVLIEQRIIHLFDDIEADTVSKVIRGIQVLLMKNKEPIHIYINTYGGDVYSGLALYDFIRSQKDVVIKTYNLGACMSAGTFIYLAGDERYSYPHARFMFHTVSHYTEGKVFETDTHNAEAKYLFEEICGIYAKYTKWEQRKWANKLRYRDFFISAKEAKDLKIVDEIIDCD